LCQTEDFRRPRMNAVPQLVCMLQLAIGNS
jgi:hypothetical protein